MPDPSPLSRRCRSVITAAVSLLAVGALAVPAGAAPSTGGDPVAAKRAEATRIAEDLARRRDEVSQLAEELNLARIEADERAADVAAAADELRRAEVQINQERAVLKGRLVEAYVSGGPPTGAMSVLVGGPGEEMALRRTYVDAVAAQEEAAIDGLEAAIEKSDARRREMAAAEAAAGETLDRVDDRRRQADEAVARQRAALDGVNDELAALVEVERARRAAEETARAKAELDARQTRERAAAQARLAAEQAARAAQAARTAVTTTTTTTRATLQAPVASAPTVAPPGGDAAPADPAQPPAAGAEAAVAEAKRQLGKPYRYGSGGPDSFDCSGLTSHAWRAAGKSLPHSSRAQMGVTTPVAVGDIQLGDLVFYGSPVHHVGIYAGSGQMVEASETGTPVRMASIYRRDLVGVGRVR